MLVTDLKRREFDEVGYIVMENILKGELLETLRDAADQMGRLESDRWGWNERSCFRRTEFRRLLDTADLVNVGRELVGEDVQLLALDLLRVRAGQPGTYWHRDAGWVCDRSLAVSVAMYLQSTGDGDDVGPLRVVPGSHRQREAPPDPAAPDIAGAVSLPVAAGTAIIHAATLWHTASDNRSSLDCWGLFPIFGPYWIKRRDSGHGYALPADLLATADPMKRQLLGLELRSSVQSYLGPEDEYRRRGDPGIDFLS
jgi:ectoine hydroxylase-related dioxygenase (phytanoyl-CoA dioxygenase family)